MEFASLKAWIAQQAEHSARAMELAISATSLHRERNAFGQNVIPVRGSVLASPVIADWNPEPDYFFHWLRDSAIVMRSVAELAQDAADETERARWRAHFDDFVRFSLGLNEANLAANPYRASTQQPFRKFLRGDAELRGLTRDKLLGEPRFNADGSIDPFKWSRPQFDGPALRALACLAHLAAGAPASEEIVRLLRQDLDFTARHAGKRCIGPWEEAGQRAHHYYVALVQLGALVHGREWASDAATWRKAERLLRASLDRHWCERQQVYAAMRPLAGETADDLVDAATLLAVLDADLPEGPHSAADPRVIKTQAAIEGLFARHLPINSGRAAPALGRNRADRYFGGGAWYPTTLAAAGLAYRRAKDADGDRAALIRRGDEFMATVRALTPEDGALSEQVDRATGAQTSARHLTWSYAAFLSTARLRREASRKLGGAGGTSRSAAG